MGGKEEEVKPDVLVKRDPGCGVMVNFSSCSSTQLGTGRTMTFGPQAPNNMGQSRKKVCIASVEGPIGNSPASSALQISNTRPLTRVCHLTAHTLRKFIMPLTNPLLTPYHELVV